MRLSRLPAVAQILLLLLALACARLPLLGQAVSPAPNSEMDPHRLWTFSTDQQKAEEDLDRTEGRVTSQETFARLGFDGSYLPYLEIENRSVTVDATTGRTTELTYSIDPGGQKALTQVVREEKQDLGAGTTKTVHTTLVPDATGRLHMLRRETERSRQTTPQARETETMVLTAPRNGGMATRSRVEGRESRRDEHTVEFRDSTLLPDGRGGWQVSEIHEGVIRENGATSTKDERILHPDARGTLVVVQRVVTEDSQRTSGERLQTVETYAAAEGVSGENNLQLQRRVTTITSPRSDGSQLVEEQVEQRNPDSPAEGLQLARKKTDIIIPGVGTAGRLDDTMNYGGNQIISIDTRKNGSAAVHVDTSRSH